MPTTAPSLLRAHHERPPPKRPLSNRPRLAREPVGRQQPRPAGRISPPRCSHALGRRRRRTAVGPAPGPAGKNGRPLAAQLTAKRCGHHSVYWPAAAPPPYAGHKPTSASGPRRVRPAACPELKCARRASDCPVDMEIKKAREKKLFLPILSPRPTVGALHACTMRPRMPLDPVPWQ